MKIFLLFFNFIVEIYKSNPIFKIQQYAFKAIAEDAANAAIKILFIKLC